MSNEIIKHDAELNTIPLRKFTPTEMNLFFSIVSRMQNQDDNVVRFSFDQLKELSNYKATANTRFIDDIQSTYEKLMGLHFGSRSKSGLTREFFVMFTRFKIDGDAPEPYVDVQVHEMARPLLNNLDSWVRYSLAEFRDLKSSYSKTMFRLLKQYRTTGYAIFTKDDFFELLDIPDSYRSKMTNVDQYVLKPIKEELSPIFKGLRVTKRYGKGRGKPVIGYTFTFKQEANDADDFSKGENVERNNKLNNIKNNSNLNVTEKEAAVRRIVGIFDDLPEWLKLEKKRAAEPNILSAVELDALKKQNNKYARVIARVEEMIAQGARLTAGDKKKLAQLRELHSSTQQRIKEATKQAQPQQAAKASQKPVDPFADVSSRSSSTPHSKPKSSDSSAMPNSAMAELQEQMKELQKQLAEEQAKHKYQDDSRTQRLQSQDIQEKYPYEYEEQKSFDTPNKRFEETFHPEFEETSRSQPTVVAGDTVILYDGVTVTDYHRKELSVPSGTLLKVQRVFNNGRVRLIMPDQRQGNPKGTRAIFTEIDTIETVIPATND
jgi:plasmid replication initiation protein